MFPTIQLGPLSIQTPGFVYLAGFWLGSTLSEKWGSQPSSSTKNIYNLVFTSFVAGFLGARLSYIGSTPQWFLKNPQAAVSLNSTLLDPVGGILIALLAGLIFSHKNDMLNRDTLDSLTPLLAVLNLSLGISHLASGKAYGSMTDLPWGIYLWGASRHPTQIFEIFFGFLGLFVTWYMTHRSHPESGEVFASFLITASMGHLITAGFRSETSYLLWGIRIEQLVAYAILAFGLWFFAYVRGNPGSDS